MKNIIINENQLKYLIESQAEVDRILDKISERGMDSLSIDEKKYLEAFSKHTGHADDFVSPIEKMEKEHEKRGEKIKSEIPQLSGLEFIYDDSLEDEESTQVSGDIIFDDIEFFLMFEIDQNKNLIGYSASADYMGSGDDLVNYLMDKYPKMTYKRADGLITHFIENEIIPNLP